MADTFLFVQAQDFSLAGAGAIAGATSITLKSFTQIDGTLLTMADFGNIGYGTLEPGNGTLEEQISFTGVTQNTNGSATLTGVKSVAMVSPYTESSGLAQTHAGSTTFVISNTSGFYNRLTAKGDDETITGTWTFTNPNYPRMDTATPAPTDDEQLATKKYVDDTAIAGAPDASATVKGITKLSVAPASPTNPIAVGDNDNRVPPIDTSSLTSGELAALPGDNTDIAVGSGNKYVTQTGLQKGAEIYAASSTGNDAYVITLSPALTAYAAGMVLHFKADVANTGAATLNVNGLGAKTIVKGLNTTLADGDIGVGMFCTVIYDGTNFVLQSLSSAPTRGLFTNGTTTKSSDESSTTQTIAHGLGTTPKKVRITAMGGTAAGIGTPNTVIGIYNGTTQSNVALIDYAGTNTFVLKGTGTDLNTGVITFDATNISIAWTHTGGTGTAIAYAMAWEAEA